MKTVLLPTDFSENAYNAITYALNLFKDVACEFYLLHTYTPVIYQPEFVLGNSSYVGLDDYYRTNALEQLNELKVKLEAEFPNTKHKFITRASFNILADEIIELAKEKNADLIIMGTQGATGAKEILLGTHTVHIIKKAMCPVIAIPSSFTYEQPKDILFPTDFEVDYKKEQLLQLLDITKNHGSSIDVLHVSKGEDLNDRQLENKHTLNYLLAHTAHLYHELPNQGITHAINGFQKNNEVNLLVMIRNKHTFFERLFIEPVIKKIGFHIKIPFMVIPHFSK